MEGTREFNSRVVKRFVLVSRVSYFRKFSESVRWRCRLVCGLEVFKVNGLDSEVGKWRVGFGGVGVEWRV